MCHIIACAKAANACQRLHSPNGRELARWGWVTQQARGKVPRKTWHFDMAAATTLVPHAWRRSSDRPPSRTAGPSSVSTRPVSSCSMSRPAIVGHTCIPVVLLLPTRHHTSRCPNSSKACLARSSRSLLSFAPSPTRFLALTSLRALPHSHVVLTFSHTNRHPPPSPRLRPPLPHLLP